MTDENEALRAQFEAWATAAYRLSFDDDTPLKRYLWVAYQSGHAAAKAETAAAVAKELERCIGIIESHHIPVGNSAAGEMACEWTYDALKTIRDAIRAGAKEREPQMPEGWAFYSADFSSNAADAFKPGSVLLTRTGRNRAAWLAMSEEDQEVNELYASGRGFTLDEAVRAAIHCVDAIRAGAKEPSDG